VAVRVQQREPAGVRPGRHAGHEVLQARHAGEIVAGPGGRVDVLQLLGDLLQALVLGLGDREVDEDDGEDGHEEVEREDGREREDADNVEEGGGDEDVEAPVDGLGEGHGVALEGEGEDLAQDDPGDGAETEGEGGDVQEEGGEGDVGEERGKGTGTTGGGGLEAIEVGR